MLSGGPSCSLEAVAWTPVFISMAVQDFRKLHTEQFPFFDTLTLYAQSNRNLLPCSLGIYFLWLLINHDWEITLDNPIWTRWPCVLYVQAWVCLLSRYLSFHLGSEAASGSLPPLGRKFYHPRLWFTPFLYVLGARLFCVETFCYFLFLCKHKQQLFLLMLLCDLANLKHVS